MIKLVGGAAAGLVISAIGIYIASIYLTTREDGGSPILIGIGALLVVGGIYFIVKGVLTFKTEKALAQNTSLDLEIPHEKGAGNTIINKNNEMLKDWKKTNDARDKLKMLEAAGAAAEENK